VWNSLPQARRAGTALMPLMALFFMSSVLSILLLSLTHFDGFLSDFPSRWTTIVVEGWPSVQALHVLSSINNA